MDKRFPQLQGIYRYLFPGLGKKLGIYFFKKKNNNKNNKSKTMGVELYFVF